MMLSKYVPIYGLVMMLVILSGCASMTKGVMEAVMERKEKDDRQCWITGRSFTGLEDLFDSQPTQQVNATEGSTLKVLMVHGIGSHAPGHSRRLLDSLVTELGFKNVDETVKTIQLSNPKYPDNLGVLRVHRYMDPNLLREMIFYELTWDSIVEEEKQLLSFDNTVESSVNRAAFNHTMKQFINDTVPDVLMYNSRYREPIQIQMSVGQALCWMMSEKWVNLPNNRKTSCDINRSDFWSQIESGNIAIISHSLGSRISLDALQVALTRLAKDPAYQVIYDKLNERFFEKLQIVAISDPNDLFSYAVDPAYINRYVDSRLCPSVSNVKIQVAPVRDVLGMREMANPLKAHTEYEIDSRVIKILVSGVGVSHGHEEVKSRCGFIESIP
jgi:hypothetical protein